MEKSEIDNLIQNKKILKLENWLLIEVENQSDKIFLLNSDFYKRESNNFLIFDIDKQEIEHYVKYLIKWMEWSRELGSILINRYIQIFIVIILFFWIYLISQRPNFDEIEKLIKWNKTNNIMTNFVNDTKIENKEIEKINPIINK